MILKIFFKKIINKLLFLKSKLLYFVELRIFYIVLFKFNTPIKSNCLFILNCCFYNCYIVVFLFYCVNNYYNKVI